MARRNPPKSFGSTVGTILQHTVYRGYGGLAGTDAWCPPVNIYRFPDRFEVCMELAGLDREQIDVRVEPGRLIVQGDRHAPDPHERDDEGAMRIVGMEIDYGPFRREIGLPEHVALDRITSSYDRGMLWVTLPLARR